MKPAFLYTPSIGRQRKHYFVPAILKNYQIHQFQAPVVMQPSRMFEPYLHLNLRKRDIKNRAWGQSIPTLSSRPVLDFHWLKTSRVLSRSQWSDYSIFVTETRCITLWSYHLGRLLFRFCTVNYRTIVCKRQDIFLFDSLRIPKMNSKAFYIYQDAVQYHCTALDDVSDSKCASSFLAGLEKVVDIQALFKYNQIHKFNIPPAHPS